MLKHGQSYTPTYRAWIAMRARCSNPNDRRWASYGGRGIMVCERWQSFANFYADMGQRPPGMSLERNDNDGDYEPNNCRWATRSDQQKNKRNRRYYTKDGFTGTTAEWADRLGLNRNTALYRMRRWGTFERGETWVQKAK